MKSSHSFASITYKTGAALVDEGRQLIGSVRVADVSYKKTLQEYQSKPRFNANPTYKMWAELNAQRDTAIDFNALLNRGEVVKDKGIASLYENYKEAGLIDEQGKSVEPLVGGRSVMQFFVDSVPGMRSIASQFKGSQGYAYKG